MIEQHVRALAFLGCAVLILACAPSFVPSSVPVSTFNPNSINTLIVQTANAAATQTESAAPPTRAFTPTPTATASDTPTPTVTFIFILPTPTVPSSTPTLPQPGSSGLRFDCAIVSKTPADGSHFDPNTDFTVVWSVMNTGTDVWDSNNADYHFKSGDRLHKVGGYDLPSSVPSGGQTEISVSLKSPEAQGTYSTTWMVKSGKTEFCRMSITIQVP